MHNHHGGHHHEGHPPWYLPGSKDQLAISTQGEEAAKVVPSAHRTVSTNTGCRFRQSLPNQICIR